MNTNTNTKSGYKEYKGIFWPIVDLDFDGNSDENYDDNDGNSNDNYDDNDDNSNDNYDDKPFGKEQYLQCVVGGG